MSSIEENPRPDDSQKTLKLRSRLRKLAEREKHLLANPADPGWEHWERLIDEQSEICEQIWAERQKVSDERSRRHEAEMAARRSGAQWPVDYGGRR